MEYIREINCEKSFFNSFYFVIWSFGQESRTIVQAVRRRLPTAAGLVRSSHVGFVVGKEALVQVSSECSGFPCHFSFHKIFRTHLLSGVGTIGQLVADVSSGLSHSTPRN
jgi:hypothetical protein